MIASLAIVGLGIGTINGPSMLIGCIIIVLGMIDAHTIATRAQRGQKIEEWEFFWNRHTDGSSGKLSALSEKTTEQPKASMAASPQQKTKAPLPAGVAIQVRPNEQRVQVASEVVKVPLGVTITVKRSRTIEHTLNLDWRTSTQGSLDFGLKQILSASIQSEIERAQGRIYQQSETVEYKVELRGEHSNQYLLTWTDIWLAGDAEIHDGNKVPFQFRDRTELEVSPVISEQ